MHTSRLLPRSLGLAVAILISGAGSAGLHAQDAALEKAKSLYLDAAYEDALGVLDGSTTLTTADGHLYRGLCLLALGRPGEADAAITRSIEVDPQATAGRQDLSPRVAAIIAEARRRVLPDMAKRRVTRGRLLFQQGDRASAAAQFAGAIVVLDDPALAGQGELQDLKTLASGFLDLIRAQTPAPTPPAAAAVSAPSPGPPSSATAAPRVPDPASKPAAAATTAGPPAATPASPPAATSANPPAAAPVTTRPIPISQVLPAWRPPDASAARQDLRGSVLVTIDPAGRVTSSVMQQIVHPAYDRLLLAAARSWRYQPATRDGQAIATQLVVPIVVQAR